jgi:hypothetical protein
MTHPMGGLRRSSWGAPYKSKKVSTARKAENDVAKLTESIPSRSLLLPALR